jgi:hypothetical protein
VRDARIEPGTAELLSGVTLALSQLSHHIATSPNMLTCVMVTSDTLGEINKQIHDFVYQSLLLYAQQTSIERCLTRSKVETAH